MSKNGLESKIFAVKSPNCRPDPGSAVERLSGDGRNHPHIRSRSERYSTPAAGLFAIAARLAAAVFLVALLAPSASAQYIYVANTGEDTVSKIDINTNVEVARYATWFTLGSPNHVATPHGVLAGPAPSRLLQDQMGNLYVLNRFFSPLHRPVLLKIAPAGGTAGTTSTGPVALPMIDIGNTSNEIDAGDTKDARIQWGEPIGTPGALGRSLCMDTTGVLWVGMYNTGLYYRVDATTGLALAPVAGIATPTGHRPYGCQVDTQGRLWSVDSGNTLVEINTFTNQVTPHNHGPNPGPPPTNFGVNYSLSLLNGCGSTPSKVYLSERALSKTYIAYDPQTSTFSNSPISIPQFSSLAVAVDLNGDIVSGERATGRVIKTTPTGTVLWDTNTLPAGPTVSTSDLHGLIVDYQNNVWAVDLPGNRIIKYSGLDGHTIGPVLVGVSPYTYGNPPPPRCPCVEIKEHPITCEIQSNGVGTYSWSFTFTNHSPFATPATAIAISSTQVTSLTPTNVVFTNPVPPNGQATVSGTFTVANPTPGMQVCLDIRLTAGEGWCCPIERVCFQLPDCPNCAKLQGRFICVHGHPVLQLSVTNLGPTTSQGVQIFSNTPGVTVSPQMTMQTFPQNTPVVIPLQVTGATPGQSISLVVNLHGPLAPRTGVYSWCCTETVEVTYPRLPCNGEIDGSIFNDLDRSGLRDSGEEALSGWTVALTDSRGASRTTTSDATGTYHFEEIPAGTYRISVQPAKDWRATRPDSGVYTVTIAGPPEGRFDFGFVKQ